MNTTQTITVAANAMGTGITFSNQLYSKVSVIIREAAPTPGRVGKAVLLWSGNNIDFTASAATSPFTTRTGADGSTSLGLWWDSGDVGVMSSFMKVQIYNGDKGGTQTVTNSVADSNTLSTITHFAFAPPLQVGEGITITNHTGGPGDIRMNGAYSVTTIIDDTHTIITNLAGNLLPATTFTTASAAVSSATDVIFTGTEGSRSLLVGEEITVTSWPTDSELNQTYTVSAASSTTFSATTATGLLVATTFTTASAAVSSATEVTFTGTTGRTLVVGEEITVTSWPTDSELNQTYTVSAASSTTFSATTATGLLVATTFTPLFNSVLSTTDLALTHTTPSPRTFLVVGEEVTLANYTEATLNQTYTVKTITSATEIVLEGTGLVVIDLVATFIEATSTTEATLTHATHTFGVGQLVSVSGIIGTPAQEALNQVYVVDSTPTTASTELIGTGLTVGSPVGITNVQIGADDNNGSVLTGATTGTFTSVSAQGDTTGTFTSVSAQGDISGIYNTAAGSPVAATTVTAPTSHDYDISVKFN